MPRIIPKGVVKENTDSNLAAVPLAIPALEKAIPMARAAAHLCKAMAKKISTVGLVPSDNPKEIPANML